MIPSDRGLFWQDDGVDHMDDAVAGLNVRFGHIGPVNCHLTIFHNNLHRRTLHGFRFGQLDDVLGEDFPRDDVVGQDSGKLLLILWLQ